MKKLILILIGAIFILSLISATGYTAPSYTNVTIVLDQTYTAPLYTNVTIVLGAVTGGGECSPTLNANWLITTNQLCNGVEVTTGTGSIVLTTGNLTLVNGANVTCKGINISASGDKVFICRGCELRT